MADLQISEFPGSLPADTDILHTKKITGEDNKTTVAAMKQHILADIPAAVQYHELTTKSINGADIIKFENANQETYHKSTFLALKNYIGNLLMPVGSLYYNYSNSTNPATLLGFGSWVRIEGMFVCGAGTSTDAGNVSRTFTPGEVTGRHAVQLQASQLPSHNHKIFGNAVNRELPVPIVSVDGTAAVSNWNGTINESYIVTHTTGEAYRANTSSTGTGAAHENTPLNVAVYIWRRVA